MDRAHASVFVNQVAQRIHPFEEAVQWLEALAEPDQEAVVQLLGHHVLQAGPSPATLARLPRPRAQRRCAAGCQHWWHRYLRDPAVVAAILSSGDA